MTDYQHKKLAKNYLMNQMRKDFYLDMKEQEIMREVENNEKSIDEIKKIINPTNIYAYWKSITKVNSLIDEAETIVWVDPSEPIPEQNHRKGEILISDYPSYEYGVVKELDVCSYKIEKGKIYFKPRGKKKYRSYDDKHKNRFLLDPHLFGSPRKVMFIILNS